MGQYYRVVSLENKEAMMPSHYMVGLKLMEHAYYYNEFVCEIIELLMSEWKGNRVVWSGDYSDTAIYEWDSEIFKNISPYSFDYSEFDTDHNEGGTIFELTEYGAEGVLEMMETISKTHVFVNYDKKIYCRFDCCKENEYGFRISPIPLLLCNSNGRGGGDYRSESDYDLVGSWAYHHVGVEKIKELSEDFEEVGYKFYEKF